MAAIDTTCPRCAAPHAKKLSLIYTEGISSVETSVHSVGKLNTIGGHKIKTTGTSVGTQQTEASKAAAPPLVPELVSSEGLKNRSQIMMGGILVGAFLGFILGGSFFQGIGITFAVIFLSLIFSQFVDVTPSAMDIGVHSGKVEALDKWNETFACGSCGYRFIPEQPTEQVVGK